MRFLWFVPVAAPASQRGHRGLGTKQQKQQQQQHPYFKVAEEKGYSMVTAMLLQGTSPAADHRLAELR